MKDAEKQRIEEIIRDYNTVIYYLHNFKEIETSSPDKYIKELNQKINDFYLKEIEIKS